MAFGGALIFAAGGAFDATLTFTMAETAEDIPPQSLLALSALFENDFVPLAVGLQLFLLGVGLAGWRLGVLPKWLAGIALAAGSHRRHADRLRHLHRHGPVDPDHVDPVGAPGQARRHGGHRMSESARSHIY